MKVMVFAAGKGTRLGELIQKKPKPLIDIGGTTPLRRTLKLLSEAGYKDVVVNVSYLRQQLIDALTPAPFGLNITISDEGDEPLETAGGIIHALPHLGGAPFLCINADVVWAEETMKLLQRLPAAFDAQSMKALLAVLPKEDALAYARGGDFFMDDARRLTFAPGKPAPYVYACVQVLNPQTFASLAPGKRGLSDLYKQWAAQDMLYGLPTRGAWVDMGTPEGLDTARVLLHKKTG